MKSLFPLLCIAAALAGSVITSSCQQQRAYPVNFLTEASGTQPGASFIILYQGTPYTRQPIFSLKHFDKFSSFLNPDGSYGVSLRLKKEYFNRLYSITAAHLDKKLLPIVNGLAFEPLTIDQPISDGIIIIWGGLNGYDLKQIGKTVTPVNPEMEKKRYKDENPRILPQSRRTSSLLHGANPNAEQRSQPKPQPNPSKDDSGRVIPEIYSHA